MIKISIIVPCYNQAQYLDECLQSVLDQTFQDWECIIVNDGSSDNTEELAKKWVEKEVRFKYFSQENKGVSAARNLGIENAIGEWILPLDADDYISTDYLELAKKYFNDNKIKVIYCNAMKFGEMNVNFILPDFNLKNLAENNLIFCAAFFRKTDWKDISGFDEEMTEGYEDWEFWIHLLKNGGEVKKIEEICFFYRIKKESRNTAVKQYDKKSILHIEKKHIDFFHQQFGTFNNLYKQNKHNEKVIETIINKRKISRFVNQIYSFFENLKAKYS